MILLSAAERPHADIIAESGADVKRPGFLKGKTAGIRKKERRCIMTQQITSGHKSIIDRCVRELYRRVFAEKKLREPVMQELYEIFGEQPEPEARDIMLSYELFVGGSLNIFAHKGSVDMRNRIIGFDISELGDDLASVGMLIVMESIRSRVMENKKKGKSTWIVLDEFHHMTERPYTAHKVNQFWK